MYILVHVNDLVAARSRVEFVNLNLTEFLKRIDAHTYVDIKSNMSTYAARLLTSIWRGHTSQTFFLDKTEALFVVHSIMAFLGE